MCLCLPRVTSLTSAVLWSRFVLSASHAFCFHPIGSKPLMGSSVEYSEPTRAILSQYQLTASNVWYIEESEIASLEVALPGVRDAWLEIRRRPRPIPPFVGKIFGKCPRPASPAEPPPPAGARDEPVKRRRQWNGLPSSSRGQGSFTSDADKRRRAAASALELVRSWPAGHHARARAAMAAPELEGFEARFVEQFANGASVACRVSSFYHVDRWCKQKQLDVWKLQWADVQAYMWAPSRSGRTSAAIARKRFHDLSWLGKYWGFPIDLAGQVPPATAHGNTVFEEKQAVPVDPAWMLAVERACEKVLPLTPCDTALCMSWLLWSSAVRLQQLQRSQFTALTSTAIWAVCSLGKGSAGFRWAIPRHTARGADIGGHIFRRWVHLSKQNGAALPSVVFELESGVPLTYQHVRKAITEALVRAGLECNLDKATTYSLRRGCATMVAIWADQAEQEANGFWLSKRSSHMPDRYHGQRVQRSLIVKLTNRELLRRAMSGPRALSWHQWGLAIASTPVQDAREAANALEAEAVLEACVPKEWAGIPALPLAFEGAPVIEAAPPLDPAASSESFSEADQPGTDASSGTSSDSSVPGSPTRAPAEAETRGSAARAQDPDISAALDAHEWQATKFQGALYIHFAATSSTVPRCKLRKGAARARPLKRVNAYGETAVQILSYGTLDDIRFCRDCLSCMRISEAELRAFLEEQRRSMFPTSSC